MMGVFLAQVAPLFGELLQAALELVEACGCAGRGGCPGCVFAPGCGAYNRCLDKCAAKAVRPRIAAPQNGPPAERPTSKTAHPLNSPPAKRRYSAGGKTFCFSSFQFPVSGCQFFGRRKELETGRWKMEDGRWKLDLYTLELDPKLEPRTGN